MIQFCEDVEGVIVGIDPISEKLLRSAKKLKAISKYGAGLDNIDIKTARELEIKVERAAKGTVLMTGFWHKIVVNMDGSLDTPLI